MGEMAQALRMLGRLPANALIEWRPGIWGFAGRCAAGLLYTEKDGSALTEKTAVDTAHFGAGLTGAKSRVFPSRAAAVAAAAEVGIQVA